MCRDFRGRGRSGARHPPHARAQGRAVRGSGWLRSSLPLPRKSRQGMTRSGRESRCIDRTGKRRRWVERRAIASGTEREYCQPSSRYKCQGSARSHRVKPDHDGDVAQGVPSSTTCPVYVALDLSASFLLCAGACPGTELPSWKRVRLVFCGTAVQSRPKPRGGLMDSISSRFKSAMACRASPVAVSRVASGIASSQAT